MQNEQLVEENQGYNPENLVRYFKYHKQFLNKTAVFYLSMDKLPIKTTYNDYKKYFDKLAFVCKKYKIDAEKYIKFCVVNLGIRTPDELIRMDNFVYYANDMKIDEQYKKIYKYYIKSANYIADECIKRNITPKEFLRELIINNQLAYEYYCGNISKYFIATIKDIDKLCSFLDSNSRDELSIILDVHEKLNQDVQETFMKFKNQRVSPLGLSEALIKQKLNKQQINKEK